MIGSTIRPMAGWAPNSSLAIGTPEARVFFEPQNTVVISSSTLKPKRRASQVDSISTTSSTSAVSTCVATTAEPTASADDTGRGAQPPESSGARVRPRHSAVAGVARVASVRVLRLITLLIGVSLLAFTLVQHSPIDPIQAYIGADVNISDEQLARLRDYWGLNAPPAERYLHWMGAQLSGNLGTSTLFKQPVADVIASRALAPR